MSESEPMTLPTAKEINPYGDLDGQCAEKHFLGKTMEEAESLFRKASLTYQEDLMFMGPVAFRFYVRAAINYIESESARGDSDMINCFFGILKSRLKNNAKEIAPITTTLAAICSYIVTHYDKFDLTESVYGDLRPRFAALRSTLLGENK